MPCTICYDGDSIEIENADELYVALDLTPSEADEVILAQINRCIVNLIQNDREFLLILQKVLGSREASKIPYLQCFGDKLACVVTNGSTLSRSLALLAREEDQEFFLKAIGRDNLRRCIMSAQDITESLVWLYGKEDQLFLDLLGWEYIFHFIHSAETLGLILKHVGKAEERNMLERMGWERVFNCLITPQDLCHLIAGLSDDSVGDLIERLTGEKMLALVPTENDCEVMCKKYLSEVNGCAFKDAFRKISVRGGH